jgi:MFS family permease
MLEKLTQSGTVIGTVVAGEGLLALALPLWIGKWSDKTESRLGGRLPYVIVGAPLACLALCVLPFVHSLVSISALVLAFYLGYFIYYPAYRALFPDLLPRERLGSAQGIQTMFREAGLTAALILCPLLFTWWAPLAFLLSGLTLAGLTLGFVLRLKQQAAAVRPASTEAQSLKSLLLCNREVRRMLIANALWEFALGGLKTFVVLYVVIGIGKSAALASALMGIVAAVAVVAAPVAGKLGDRFGVVRVMRIALTVFAVGMLLPSMTRSLAVLLPAMPLIGFGGAVAMTLPYALIAEHLPQQNNGVGAGLYEFSRGVGSLLGPIATGAVIDLLGSVFKKTHGYGAMWLVCGVALFLSLPLLPKEAAAKPQTTDC